MDIDLSERFRKLDIDLSERFGKLYGDKDEYIYKNKYIKEFFNLDKNDFIQCSRFWYVNF